MPCRLDRRVTRIRDQLAYAIFRTIRELVAAYRSSERIFVDVPIGLPWVDVPIRPCDRLARDLLGRPRASSVFPVPCREALRAADVGEARKVNVAVLGRSLTAQTWGISGKIAEVDVLLVGNSHAREQIREIHPEICFWALAGGSPMRYRKTTAAGRNERLEVIARHYPDAYQFLAAVLSQTRRADIQTDDVLDAIVAFITAEAPTVRLGRLAGEPSFDQHGLPMEMVYVTPCRVPWTPRSSGSPSTPSSPTQKTKTLGK
jgi:predicted RNase H-like nuclease